MSPSTRDKITGAEIRRSRQERGWNQTELGMRTGFSPSAISRMEGGLRRLDIDTLGRLAEALEVLPERFGLLPDNGKPAPAGTAQTDASGIRLLRHGEAAYGTPRPLHGRQPNMETANPMTTLRALSAARESVTITLESDPTPDELGYVVRAAAEHYAQIYSKIPPGLLYEEIHQTRAAVLGASPTYQDVVRASGWLTSLLGNLSFHLSDLAAARLHLCTSASIGRRYEDLDLRAWANGALAMVARSAGDHTTALGFARTAVDTAPPGLRRAQALMWAYLPSLAARGDAGEADAAIAEADRQLEAAELAEVSGRFGFDIAERNLHEADAQQLLGRHERACRIAQASMDACETGTPGWAAAALALAQAEAAAAPSDAIARAVDVLDHVPPERLRATARTRLSSLTRELTVQDSRATAELREQMRALPTLVGIHGYPIG